MTQTLLLTLTIVAIVILLLGVRVFFTKRWGFPSSHVDDNKKLTDMGLSCHRHQHHLAQTEENLFDRIAKEERVE
ncbi:hypothetical protein QYZ87_03205 [Porphyromonadaceae bacterium W3.11]|nr:hypothetical protein [Porphyromonadaceae bacterium W3.11]